MSNKKRRKPDVEWNQTRVVDQSLVHITQEENELNRRFNPDLLENAVGNLLWPARFTEDEGELLDELRNVDIARLVSPQEGKIIVSYVVEGKTIAQIADATGLSRQRISAALKNVGRKLRRHLDIE